jgi:putative endopeptidase
MSNLACRVAALALLITGALSYGATAQSISTAAQPAPSAPPATGAWGFDLAGADFAAKPGDDFFRYANGAWYDHAMIPADRSSIGIFTSLSITAEARIRDILERGEQGVDPSARVDAAKIGTFYKAFMDEARAEALDAQPIAPFIQMIRATTTPEQLVDLMGAGRRSFFSSVLP